MKVSINYTEKCGNIESYMQFDLDLCLPEDMPNPEWFAKIYLYFTQCELVPNKKKMTLKDFQELFGTSDKGKQDASSRQVDKSQKGTPTAPIPEGQESGSSGPDEAGVNPETFLQRYKRGEVPPIETGEGEG